MIEVERKFLLHEGDKERLINDAVFVGQKKIHDTYYDRADYSLTTSDRWLRNRNGVFELKISVNAVKVQGQRQADQYQEITDEKTIREVLDIPVKNDFPTDLAAAGYTPYGSWVTTRTEYKQDGFVIDFDEVDFGLNMVEIETLVADQSEVERATEKILEFAKSHQLSFDVIPGKNTEYLRRFKPEHYQALITAGII